MHVLARKVTTWMLISRVALNRSQIVRYFRDFFSKMCILTKIEISMNVFLVPNVPVLQFVEMSMDLTLVNVRKVS